jgi:hypothetical protein
LSLKSFNITGSSYPPKRFFHAQKVLISPDLLIPGKHFFIPKKDNSTPKKKISSPKKKISSPERIQKIKIKKKILIFMAFKLSFRIQKIIGTNILLKSTGIPRNWYLVKKN